jgi:hypothetical protein
MAPIGLPSIVRRVIGTDKLLHRLRGATDV